MRRAVVLVVVVALTAAGCGGDDEDDKISAEVGAALASDADVVAERAKVNRVCHALQAYVSALQQGVVDAINNGDVPEALQEPLQSRANELEHSTRSCLPGRERRIEEFAAWVRKNSEKPEDDA